MLLHYFFSIQLLHYFYNFQLPQCKWLGTLRERWCLSYTVTSYLKHPTKHKWQCFLEHSLVVKGHPIFYQIVDNAILDEVVKDKCNVSQILSSAEQQPQVTIQVPQDFLTLPTCSKMGCSCAYYWAWKNSNGHTLDIFWPFLDFVQAKVTLVGQTVQTSRCHQPHCVNNH